MDGLYGHRISPAAVIVVGHGDRDDVGARVGIDVHAGYRAGTAHPEDHDCIDHAIAPVNRRRMRVLRAGVGECRRRKSHGSVFVDHLVGAGIHHRRKVFYGDGSCVGVTVTVVVAHRDADRIRIRRRACGVIVEIAVRNRESTSACVQRCGVCAAIAPVYRHLVGVRCAWIAELTGESGDAILGNRRRIQVQSGDFRRRHCQPGGPRCCCLCRHHRR